MKELRIVVCTFPDPGTARQIGTLLVKKQLAACVTLLPQAESIFRWQKNIESQTETLTLIKTTAEAWPALEQELTTLHPYEVPEIVSIAPDQVASPYAAWLAGAIRVCGEGGPPS